MGSGRRSDAEPLWLVIFVLGMREMRGGLGETCKDEKVKVGELIIRLKTGCLVSDQAKTSDETVSHALHNISMLLLDFGCRAEHW